MHLRQKRILSFCFLFLIGFIFYQNTYALYIHAVEPENLYYAKQRLIDYHNSGDLQRAQELVIKSATKFLKEALKNKDYKKPLAIVMDIDETLLSNYNSILALNFGGSKEDIIKAILKANYPVIKPTLDFFNFAKKNNVAIFIVTGRKEKFRRPTVKNLRQAGYKGWKKLYMLNNDYKLDSVTPYKISMREKIEKDGYKIIINIGDQPSDLNGEYAEAEYKMPNPFYLVL